MKAQTIKDVSYDNSITLYSELPPRGMKDSWLLLLQKSCDRVGESLSNLTTPTDIRPIMLTRYVVSLVPDPEARKEIFDKWDELLFEEIEKHKNNNGGDISNEEEGKINILVALSMIGMVTSYTDLHVGIYHRVVIGTA